VIFKTTRQEQEWEEAVAGEKRIIPVVLYAAELSLRLFGKQVVVTGILRTDQEHRALLKRLGIDYYPTVHSFWRGVDLRSWIYTPDERDMLVAAINRRFDYGRGKRCALYHDIGAGGHFHLQTPSEKGAWT